MRKQQLDGLRLLAFLLVFFFHACWRQGFLYGQFGTDLFFALSGFLITRLLLLNSGGSVLQEIRTFYARRTLRIFPVYYVYLAILFLNHRLNHAVWYVFYVFNFGFFIHKWRDCWGHLWTLSVEEQFYLFYPVLLLSTPPRWRLLTILILLASFEYCNSTLWDSQFRWYLLTPTRTALMWGALAGYIDVKCSQKWQKGGAIFA